MSTRPERLAAATQLSDQPFNRDLLLEATRTEILTWTIEAKARRAGDLGTSAVSITEFP